MSILGLLGILSLFRSFCVYCLIIFQLLVEFLCSHTFFLTLWVCFCLCIVAHHMFVFAQFLVSGFKLCLGLFTLQLFLVIFPLFMVILCVFWVFLFCFWNWDIHKSFTKWLWNRSPLTSQAPEPVPSRPIQ